MTDGPSQHLTWAELACKDGSVYPQEWREDRAPILAEAFEAIRVAVGHPLTVLSAYRSPAHNASIGGARKSQHVQGRALDLRPPAGMTVDAFYAICLGAHEAIRGIGRYQTFVHVDVRPTARLVAWNGGSQMKDDRA